MKCNKLNYSTFNSSPFLLGVLEKTKIQEYLKSLDKFYTELEEVFFTIAKITIFNAEGYILDIIGQEFGVLRAGMSDAEYRVKILVKYMAYSISLGTMEAFLVILKDFLKCKDIKIDFYYPAKFSIYQISNYSNMELMEWLIPLLPVGVSFILQGFFIDEEGNLFEDEQGNIFIVEF